MENSSFLVVGGMPRSGTRQFADYLNASKRISIQGELKPDLIPAVKHLLHTSETLYQKHPGISEIVKKKKRKLIFELFKGLSKSHPVKDFGGCVGFKNPNAEFYVNDVLEIIKDSYESLTFYYCIRDVLPCLSSLRCAPWYGASAEYFINTYIRSMNSAISASKKSNVKIAILHLDDYIRCKSKEEWVDEKLFKILNLDLTKEDINRILSIKNVNSTRNRFGIEKNGDEITSRDLRVLKERESELNDCIEDFNFRFSSGINLLDV